MIEKHDDYLSVDAGNGITRRYHWIWLRDKCPCSQCFNKNSRQKYFDSSTIPIDIRPVEIGEAGSTLRIIWMGGHKSEYDLSWLARQDYSHQVPPRPEGAKPAYELWGGMELPAEARFSSLQAQHEDETLRAALDALLRFGVVTFKGDPIRKVSFETFTDRVAGFLDRTYFGEFFDLNVKPEATTDSVAFSTRELPLHTDIPYYSPPPDFQFLYGLDVSPECARRGIGSTRFVDGLAAAIGLRSEEPEAFAALTRIAVINRAEYPQASKIYENIAPIIKLAKDGSIERLLNNPSKMFFDNVEFDDMLPLYRAYKIFKERLVSASPAYSHNWSDGDLVIWDNRRILHGRGEFGSQGVKRILRGGYISETELLARRRFLRGNGPAHYFASETSRPPALAEM
ncbi:MULTISPECIES: TauD/TfdA family dioxygenase [Rhizobium/Agrobacterium group]|uniref:Gamma butyrobetaine hydroxylase protein n=2 Tax=Rhizobium/Agrobacterium group TaxID=227290 RepID=B9JZY5_ALLAM|nr:MULTISPECIES: TauD/TfdA family dioxygenase [Rhizobium/Agrobacterium group]ACM37444.1 gamma butyrobetaine hydroxylase protein [Allorhizobium ampelinum S4]MCF1450577.1 DUF971 domain-containing protein [Allorhizobium ampelinum]MCF1463512.1 DUF971 domain-containing protein [Allorhizobium ampelinum]MCF1470754.1 DUF971 domain-containing protein [Allorhizobium ampelinum]MCF1496176.1 DUF971 domain-containing protein [Allorhizobium ampelinum]